MNRFIMLLALLMMPMLAQASLLASVDRTRLVEGDTLELTLETPQASRSTRPDFSPLEEHFRIQATRQLNLVSQADGSAQRTTRWVITLLPKRTGYVAIPPIRIGDLQSEPIGLQILTKAQAAQDTVAQLAPIFIDSEVDVENPYVQAQVLLTLKVYHSVSLYDDSILSGLEIPDARVESLGPARQSEQLINGVRHGVIEVRYAIYPQQNGILEIPSQLFSATTLQPVDPSARFSARTGRLVQVRSPSIMLDVRPVPDGYPSGAPWIPASELTFTEHWQPDPGVDLITGEPLTRTLTIEAQGLSASQLPIMHSLVPGTEKHLRQYTDQPKLENQTSDTGIRGIRQDSAALIAQTEGVFQVPELQLYWWDTIEDRLRTERLDSVTLNVSGMDNLTPSISEPGLTQTNVSSGPAVWPWQLASLLLSIALSTCLLLLYRARRALRDSEVIEEEEILGEEHQGNPLGDLQLACRGNHPAEARKALEAWARQQHSEGLIALTHHNQELAEALDELNACLFGQTESPWRGKPLWRAVRMTIQSRQRAAEAPSDPLGTLYPDV
ncbi:BatD family protein [Pseudomonas saliphila]|uniref:BatD family protein n=1 Tax=Pseudomonas saliphila TaxID=2586906 RepID=UPI00123BA138|nr:BatD family protein [Pseudomonas saliphila]